MISSLRTISAPTHSPCPPLGSAELCSTTTPFSTRSAKLNIPGVKVKLSSTLPTLNKKSSSKEMVSRSFSADNTSADSSRNSVSVTNEKLKLAIAKSMPRALPKDKELEKKRVARQLPTKRDDTEVSNSESPAADASNHKVLTEADIRQIAIERANRAVQRGRELKNADKEAAALERRSRAEQIESKQKQRVRYRAEVYAVNAILKAMEMSRFDELRQERGADRSFLENCSSDDDSSSLEGSAAVATLSATPSSKSSSRGVQSNMGKDVREPGGKRGRKSSSRRLHLSSQERLSSKERAPLEKERHGRDMSSEGEEEKGPGCATEVSCSGEGRHSPPPSTSDSEAFGFGFVFGV